MGYRKRNYKKSKKKNILLIIILFLILCFGIHLTKSILNKKAKKQNVKVLVKNNKKDANGKSIKKQEEKKPNPDDILKGANVTVEGNKYSWDALEVQDVLKQWKDHVDGKKIAFLTFDDGPSTTVTPKILDILKRNNIKGTFFIVGEVLAQSDRSKDLLKRTIKEGHAIANHSYSHNYKHLYPGRVVNTKNFMDEIHRNEELMKSVLGKDFHTRVIRFPGGHMSWKGTKEVDNIMKEQNYVYIDWNALTGDAEGRRKTPQQLAQRIRKEVTEKNKPDRLVVLMHDTYGKENTAKSLQDVIDHLKSLGYEFKTLK